MKKCFDYLNNENKTKIEMYAKKHNISDDVAINELIAGTNLDHEMHIMYISIINKNSKRNNEDTNKQTLPLIRKITIVSWIVGIVLGVVYVLSK